MSARPWWSHPLLAGLAGVFAGGLTIMVVEAAAHRLLGVADPTRPETIAPSMYAAVVVAWIAGAAVASAVATAWHRRRSIWPGTVAGLVPFVGALVTVATIPHPTWAIAAAVLLMPAAALLAARALVARPDTGARGAA